MKKYISLVFITLSLFNYAQKQLVNSNMQVYYEMTFKPDSTQSKKVTSQVTLYLTDKNSIFQDSKKYKIDSIASSNSVSRFPTLPIFNVNHVIFKDLKNKKITYTEVIDNVNFGYNEIINESMWEIKGEKKKVLGFDCGNAEINLHGRKYIAWYTSSIHIPDGPYKFSGLPGIILELYDDRDNFKYEAIAIVKKNLEIIYDSTYKEIDRLKLHDSKMNNIIKNTKIPIKFNPMEKK